MHVTGKYITESTKVCGESMVPENRLKRKSRFTESMLTENILQRVLNFTERSVWENSVE